MVQEFSDTNYLQKVMQFELNGSYDSVYLRGYINYFEKIPAMAFIKHQDMFLWQESLETIGNGCIEESRLDDEFFIAPNNEIINSLFKTD